jgi:hypothetical protein
VNAKSTDRQYKKTGEIVLSPVLFDSLRFDYFAGGIAGVAGVAGVAPGAPGVGMARSAGVAGVAPFFTPFCFFFPLSPALAAFFYAFFSGAATADAAFSGAGAAFSTAAGAALVAFSAGAWANTPVTNATLIRTANAIIKNLFML